MRTFPLLWIPLLPFLGAAFNLLIGRKLGKRVAAFVACASVGAACVVACFAVAGPLYDSWREARMAGAEAHVVPVVHKAWTWIAAWKRRTSHST